MAWIKTRTRTRLRLRAGGAGSAIPPILSNTLLYQDGTMAKYQDGTLIQLQIA